MKKKNSAQKVKAGDLMQNLTTGEIVKVTHVSERHWCWNPVVIRGVVMNEATKNYQKIN